MSVIFPYVFATNSYFDLLENGTMFCDTIVIEDHLYQSVPCACVRNWLSYPFIYNREHTGVYLLLFYMAEVGALGTSVIYVTCIRTLRS